MIVAGIGCRRGATADAVLEALDIALAQNGLSRSALGALAVSEDKRDEAGIITAAGTLSLPVIAVSNVELTRAAGGTLTVSQRVLELKGVPSVSEAAALAAAGEASRLIAPRSASASATCALAIGDGP